MDTTKQSKKWMYKKPLKTEKFKATSIQKIENGNQHEINGNNRRLLTEGRKKKSKSESNSKRCGNVEESKLLDRDRRKM